MSPQLKLLRALGIFPLVMVAILVLSTLMPGLLPDFAPTVAVSNIQPSEGLSFAATLGDPALSDDKRPTGARLYLIEARRGTALHRFDGWCVMGFACAWLMAVVDSNYPTATHEVRRQLGPGGSVHKDIFDKGGGRFSVWKGGLYFSLPDQMSFANVKRLDLRVPSFAWLEPAKTDAFFASLQGLSALGLVGWVIAGVTARWMPFFYRNVLPGLLISAALLAIGFIGGEAYLRGSGMFPVSHIRWVGRFVDQVGFTFEPGETIKWTNGTDFWAAERVNSLGFVDREPVLPKPPGMFRILLVGDSFVEAVQVSIAQKLQTLLTTDLKQRFPGGDFDTIALGYSGTGQSNQLPFYERNRRDFKPDLVILLFVANDFANNSNLLESLRYGYHPDHPPLLFMRAGEGQACERLPIDAGFGRYLLAGDLAGRAKQLRALSADIDRDLRGWTTADDLDGMFYRKGPLPPAFEAAVASTRCAFAEWKKLAKQDGFKLLVASHVKGEQLNRLQQITRDLGLPLIDLDREFSKKPDPALVHFRRDSHWSPTGHRWAADAILNYLADNEYVPAAGKTDR
jgi:hypothetical protein